MAGGKASLLLALGMPKKGMKVDDEESGDDAETDTGSEAKRDAAKDLIRAVKSGDVEGVMDALERHYAACAHGEKEESEGSDYSEDD